jgi:hypothetical protein
MRVCARGIEPWRCESSSGPSMLCCCAAARARFSRINAAGQHRAQMFWQVAGVGLPAYCKLAYQIFRLDRQGLRLHIFASQTLRSDWQRLHCSNSSEPGHGCKDTWGTTKTWKVGPLNTQAQVVMSATKHPLSHNCAGWATTAPTCRLAMWPGLHNEEAKHDSTAATCHTLLVQADNLLIIRHIVVSKCLGCVKLAVGLWHHLYTQPGVC